MKKTTKERIIDAALDLFSEKGYDGVGIDLIAESGGIKGPSIYKHFKGKEDILNTLMQQVEEYYERNFNLDNIMLPVPDSIEKMITDTLKRIEFTMHDPIIKKVRRILTIEQFRNPYIAELMTKHTVIGIKGLYQRIFAGMIENHLMREDDPEALAIEFTLPVSMYIQMYDRHPEQEKEIMEKIEKHIQHFITEYGEEKTYE